MFFGVGGISLEIAGFVMLLKYLRQPTENDLDSWIKKLPKTKENEDIWREPMAYRKFEALHEGDSPRIMSPTKFMKFWNYRKKIGIYFVIAGLSSQIIQISLTYIF